MTDVRWTASEEPRPGRETVLLSNPLGAPLELWDDVTDALAPSFRVLRYDSPGHGGSPLRDEITIETLTDVALEVLDAAEVERAHVVGLSLGAMVGLSLAARAPGRTASLAVLCSSAYFPDKQVWQDRAATARAEGLDGLAGGSLARWFTPGWAAEHPDAIEAARAMFVGTDPEGYARTAEAVGALDLRPSLPEVAAETLVVAGDADPSTPPAMLRAIADAVPHARYEELAGAHWLPVERPDAVVERLVPFLTRG
ncbi:alpha/beta fold hydrolase [Isoptericola sp. AK164]|uniref:alpha/beta fold hydrolase n=1 Tax=Isoptericola sp. AK164 TaxID=3024246 RepID=UPI0024183502|nr:alpha/beta fold hydrolase [Isoptericola sp. AK164]